jgi:hypothetical protein
MRNPETTTTSLNGVQMRKEVLPPFVSQGSMEGVLTYRQMFLLPAHQVTYISGGGGGGSGSVNKKKINSKKK